VSPPVIDANWVNSALGGQGYGGVLFGGYNGAPQGARGKGAASATNGGAPTPCLNPADFSPIVVPSSATTNAPINSFGTQRRNQFYGPQYFDTDFTVMKTPRSRTGRLGRWDLKCSSSTSSITRTLTNPFATFRMVPVSSVRSPGRSTRRLVFWDPSSVAMLHRAVDPVDGEDQLLTETQFLQRRSRKEAAFFLRQAPSPQFVPLLSRRVHKIVAFARHIRLLRHLP